MDDSLVRAATTATSLDAEHDRGNTNKTQSKATLNEPSSLGTSSGSGPRRQETIRGTIAQTGFENVSKTSNGSLLVGTSQAQEITSLKRRVKRLEKKGGSRTHRLKRLYKVGLSARIESSEDEVNVHRDEDMFGVNDLEGDEVIVETEVDHEVVVETEVASKDVNLSVDEVTLAQALAALKSAKPKADKVMLQEPEQGTITTTTAATTVTAASTRPKAKGLVIHEEEQATTPTVSSQQPSQVKVQDKGKGIMVEEPLKMKKKDQISFDEQEAIRLQAEFNKEERLAREKDEANHNQLKNKSFNNIQELFDKAFKRVKTFVDYRTELMEESSKKAEVMEENDGDDVTIDATPLSTKSLTIVDYKIYKEGKKSYFQIIRADVKARFKKTEPVNYMDNFLLLNLKTMFEHHVEDSVWKNQQGLVKMFNAVKLQVDYECEMAFELLRLVKKQLKEGYVPE
ncbi:hypothetical protein Tco_0893242 [Tanacetum coccineum]|uniref:Uncharacterized protein n=1 Tax=Tanacetum coccineum TaxID=301880 RepID=A0ABQ5C888_9ASTR